MNAARSRITNVLLALVLLTGLVIVLMLATGVRGGPLDPLGAPGSTPGVRLPGTPISGPTTISQPGHYYLTNDLVLSGGQTGIMITTSSVSVDLGGHAIRGVGPGNFGIRVVGPLTAITVRNGTLRDLIHGIDLGGTESALVEDVMVYEAEGRGIAIGTGSVVQDCMVSGAAEGVVVEGSNSTVRRCELKSNDFFGVLMSGGDHLVEDSFFVDNAVLDAGAAGLFMFGANQIARGNTFKERNAVAILLDGAGIHTLHENIGCDLSVRNLTDLPNSYTNNPCIVFVP